MKGFSTKAIHGRTIRQDVHRSLRFPVYDSVSFEFDSARDLQLAFEGRKPAHMYSRITNPTIEDFEQRINLLAGSRGVIAVSSGMAAISNLILALAETGSNIISTKFLFGNTYSLFEKTLKPWGLNLKCINMDDPDSLKASIDDRTRAVFLEVISNPQLQVPDIKKIAEITAECQVPLILDGTLTTSYIFNSKAFGVNVEVVSTTKYISGGATSVGGVIIDNGNFDWKNSPKLEGEVKQYGGFALIAKLKREVYRNMGACMSPHNAYMQSLGLETLSLRIQKSCSNALEIAKKLEQHAKVKSVNYPGLETSRYHDIAKAQFKDNYGGLLTFELADRQACYAFMDALKLIKRSTNLNDNKTLILHPASTIFCEYSAEERAEMCVGEAMMRLSVGIEDFEDLMDDINLGLEGI